MPPPEPLSTMTTGCGPGVAGVNKVADKPSSRTSRRRTPRGQHLHRSAGRSLAVDQQADLCAQGALGFRCEGVA